MTSPLPSLTWLESRMLFGMKAGLENIRELCARLGNPHQSLRCIHIVGTNGKGSTSYWLMRILEAHGKRVALFTSPHLVSMRERMRVGDFAIPAADLNRLLSQVQQASTDLETTFFEALTAVAFCWFAEQNVDYVVLEAGLGGRLDSTNLVDSVCSVLTSIGLDHTEILGDTLEKILYEKIGVWKAQTPLFHNLQDVTLCAIVDVEEKQLNRTAVRVSTDSSLRLPQPGLLYQENASLSMACAQFLLRQGFEDSLARNALLNSVWAGRQQELRNPQSQAVEWLLDGAHNGHAALRLAETLRANYPGQKFPLVLAILKTKFPQEIIAPLLPLVSQVILTRTPHPKMRECEELLVHFQNVPCQVISTVPEALRAAELLGGPVLCTGSLYFVGAAIHELRGRYSELAWFRQFTPSANELK